MKKLILLVLLFSDSLLAQSQNVIIQGDSLMIFRNLAAWQDRDVPDGYQALYLPNISKRAGRRAVLTRILIPAAAMGASITIDRTVFKELTTCKTSKRDCAIFFPVTTIVGAVAMPYLMFIAPIHGNLAYKDRRRALIGTAMRLGGPLLCATGSESLCNVGLVGGFTGGIVYNLATIPRSRRDYQARLQQYEIYD